MAKPNHRIVILGGALSGPTAAARARETNVDASIILLERAEAISYAVGGLPYYLSGEVDARGHLAPHRAAFFSHDYDIEVRTKVSVERFDAAARKVYTSAGELRYDALIYALGAGSIMPPVFGDGAANLSLLRNPAHLQHIDGILSRGATRVVIVGGGFYGVEAADCLARRGCTVSLIERGPQLLPEYSATAAARAAAALTAEGVDVRLGSAVEQVERKRKNIVAVRAGGRRIECDLILLTAGVRPRTEMFAAAGGKLERDGSIHVDERCGTSLAGVYATSICVSHTHAVTRKPIWTAQATDADKTAQVAGANAAGGAAKLGPTLGTAITRAGALHLARTGLTQLGGRHKVERIQIAGHSCDPFFRGSEALELTLYYGRESERVLGAEVIGRAGVDKRIDVIATAILGKLTLTQLAGLDLAYSPPYSMVRDIVNAAGVIAAQAKHVHAWTLEAFAERGDEVIVYDVRSAAQRKAHKSPRDAKDRLSATPLDIAQLRAHKAALGNAKQVVFVCETGRESYLAARAASQLGCRDAGYLSGGLSAWRDAKLR